MATKRQAFYSFHDTADCGRASKVRNIGAIEGNKPASDQDWEKIKRAGDEAVKKWIKEQMKNRSCAVVLVGNQTANRKWINYEIVESWNAGMGVVGIHIYGLKNEEGYVSQKGDNPFDYITQSPAGGKLSSIVTCYDPPGANSKERLDWISKFICDAVDEAIKFRENHQGISLRSL